MDKKFTIRDALAYLEDLYNGLTSGDMPDRNGECNKVRAIINILEEYKSLGNLKDITGAEEVEVAIREDGKVIWVNTEKGCALRICRIKNLKLDDSRKLLTKFSTHGVDESHVKGR